MSGANSTECPSSDGLRHILLSPEWRLWLTWVQVRLCGFQLMLQAPRLDCECFDPLPFLQDPLTSSKIDVCRREVVQALVQTLMIVVFHEGGDLSLQFTRQIIQLFSKTLFFSV